MRDQQQLDFELIQLDKMRSIFILTLCLSVAQIAHPLEKYINYGVDQEGVELFNFFHNVQNGFYVDIGCYDSIFASNTLNLESMGWEGINIDASPVRLPRFFYSRPWEPSLNYAIGDKDQYVTLYQLAEDSSSTVSPKVKDFVKDYKPVMNQAKIPSISMKQLCERFFYRRPLFLNLDIEGFGSMALSSNDWKNPKCRPQVIFSQINDETKVTGLPLPEVVLKEQGYKKWQTGVGLNEIYITEELFDKYTQIYNEGKQLSMKKGIYNIASVAYGFVANVLKLPTTVVPHYEPKTDGVYYLFAKYKQPVDLCWANQFSNHISDRKNRPIIVLNYDPIDSVLLLRSSDYSASVVNTPEMKYYNITVFNADKTSFSVYVVDHSMASSAPPRIVVTNLGNYQKIVDEAPAPKPAPTISSIIAEMGNSSTDAKALARVQELLNQTLAHTNNTNIKYQARKRQIFQLLQMNHNYDKSKLEQILTKLNTIELPQAQPIVKKNEKEDPRDVQSSLTAALRSQVFVLLTVFFALLIINVVVCISTESREQANLKSLKKLKKRAERENRAGERKTEEQFEQQIQKQETQQN